MICLVYAVIIIAVGAYFNVHKKVWILKYSFISFIIYTSIWWNSSRFWKCVLNIDLQAPIWMGMAAERINDIYDDFWARRAAAAAANAASAAKSEIWGSFPTLYPFLLWFHWLVPLWTIVPFEIQPTHSISSRIY